MEMYVTRDLSAINAHTEHGMPFDLICIVCYALKITSMSVTVASQGFISEV